MKRPILYMLLALALILITSSALAGVEAISLSWWTVDGGGGASSSAAYSLQGSAGQPDAGKMQGGNYTLVGGFLGGAASPQLTQNNLFLPLVTR